MLAARTPAVALLVVLAFLAGSCGASGEVRTSDGSGLRVVATTTILGDLVAGLVGDDGEVDVLMQPGQDPHAFALSAQQAEAMRRADLVVANGLGLEAGMDDAIDAAAAEGVMVLRIAPMLDPLPAGIGHAQDIEPHDGESHDDESHHDEFDPHVWLDPVRMADAASILAQALAETGEGPSAQEWARRGEQLAQQLRSVNDELEQVLSVVPADCRRLVTNHDAFGYFADRHGFEVVGTVVPGTSTQADANARDFAQLARTIRETGVPAIFAETSESRRLADSLAEEVGRGVAVIELHSGSLGEPGSGAETYVDMLRSDAQRIADALADC